MMSASLNTGHIRIAPTADANYSKKMKEKMYGRRNEKKRMNEKRCMMMSS